MDRSGDVGGGGGVTEAPMSAKVASQLRSDQFHNRPATRAGTRNQLDSSFSLTGLSSSSFVVRRRLSSASSFVSVCRRRPFDVNVYVTIDSGAQYDDGKGLQMSNKKITQPPGGKISGLWSNSGRGVD